MVVVVVVCVCVCVCVYCVCVCVYAVFVCGCVREYMHLSLTHSFSLSLSLSLPPSLSLCLYMPRAESLWQVRKGGREGGRERHLEGKPFKPFESLSKRNAWVSHFAARLSLLLRLYAGIQREREAETVSERT